MDTNKNKCNYVPPTVISGCGCNPIEGVKSIQFFDMSNKVAIKDDNNVIISIRDMTDEEYTYSKIAKIINDAIYEIDFQFGDYNSDEEYSNDYYYIIETLTEIRKEIKNKLFKDGTK